MTDFVYVPVPVDQLPQVYGLLGQARAVSPLAREELRQVGRDEEEVGGDEDVYRGWARGALKQLYWDSADEVKCMLALLAQRPGERVSSREIGPHCWGGKPDESMGGALGGFGLLCKSRFGLAQPFEVRRVSGETTYMMPAPVAAVLREINDG